MVEILSGSGDRRRYVVGIADRTAAIAAIVVELGNEAHIMSVTHVPPGCPGGRQGHARKDRRRVIGRRRTKTAPAMPPGPRRNSDGAGPLEACEPM